MAAALAYAASAPIIISSHKKLGKYEGEKGRNLDCFISQCEAYWVVANITNEKTKVLTALSRLEDKVSQWAIELTNFMANNVGALLLTCNMWPHLRNLLKWYLRDVTSEDRVIIKLDKLINLDAKARSTRNVEHYIAKFNALMARISGLSAKDKKIQFIKGLCKKLLPVIMQ